MTKRIVTVVLFCCVSVANFQRCDQDIFKNLKLIKDHEELTVKTPDELRDAASLEVVNSNVPILCKYSVQNMPNLYRLEFRKNNMGELQPGAFKNVPNLINLKITNNHLKVIPNGVFSNIKLTRIDLRMNRIERVETGAFDDMPDLTVIEMDFNRLKEIDPSWFERSPKVQRLSLGDNLLEAIPEGAFINMGGNFVDIWLMNNRISTVHPNAFRGITRANYLWLQDNRIETLDDGIFADVEELERLSLSGNKLKCVSDAFLGNLHAKSVNFDSNPLDCESCLPMLKTWSKDNGVDCQLMVRKLECVVERVRNTLNETRSMT